MVLYDSSLPFVWGLWGLQSKLVKIIILNSIGFTPTPSHGTRRVPALVMSMRAEACLCDRTNDMVLI